MRELRKEFGRVIRIVFDRASGLTRIQIATTPTRAIVSQNISPLRTQGIIPRFHRTNASLVDAQELGADGSFRWGPSQSAGQPKRARILWAGRLIIGMTLSFAVGAGSLHAKESPDGVRFFEQKIRPLLMEHCYECHSEEAGEQQGGLLLDRQSGWIEGGETNKAVIPGDPDASLLIAAIRYDSSDLQMPPDERLGDDEIALLEQWVRRRRPRTGERQGRNEFFAVRGSRLLVSAGGDALGISTVESGRGTGVRLVRRRPHGLGQASD